MAKKAQSQIKSLELSEKVSQLESGLKRALADYDNLQKRIEKQKSEFVKMANANLLDKLLSVLDDLQRVQRHLKDEGLDLAIEEFLRVLKAEQVTEIEVLGKQFDANLMDCVEVCQGKEDCILEVINKGYLLNGRVLRPAQVKVGGKK